MIDLISRNPAILLAILAAIAAEWIWRTRFAGRNYDLRAMLGSFGVAIGGFILKPLNALLLTPVFAGLAQIAPVHLSMQDWRVWIIGFFAVEFAYYWFHRWSHTVNWLWATHAVHHSANEMALPAALRLGWTGLLSGGWLVYTPLVLIGFAPQMVIGLLTANLLYQYWLHTEAIPKLGAFEWVFNSPSHHRAHHASNAEFLDCNFGGVLIIFDRVFGSFRVEPDTGGLRFGLTDPMRSYNPVVISLRQWTAMIGAMRRASDLRGAFAIAIGSPASLERQLLQADSPQSAQKTP
jgi:sterol desaturase/sphingolipid hydroxylase (fatty acid hydroxylase superfamily)